MHSNPFINHTQEGLCVDAGIFGADTSIFDFKTGKWAEIVEEKKPYTNFYDTEFNEGDEHWAIMDGEIKGPYGPESSFIPTLISSGALIERECHQYLADNWDELNKNK